MKLKVFLLLLSAAILAGCSVMENAVIGKNIIVNRAGYHHWTKTGPGDSSVTERGTDLSAIISGWPEGYEPEYFIFDNKTSGDAYVSNKTDMGLVISAQIVTERNGRSNVARSSALSDRLIYSTPDGDLGHVKIDYWNEVN